VSAAVHSIGVADAPLDHDEFGRWRTAADRALAAAETLAAAGFPEWACFQAEQAAQLAVKGLLHGIGEPAWGHDLTVLVDQTARTVTDPWPAAAARWAERLARFYIATRYPDALPGGVPGNRFGDEDVETARHDAVGLLAAVDRAWAVLGAAPEQP
jgi:HEPN domain-containing protein